MMRDIHAFLALDPLAFPGKTFFFGIGQAIANSVFIHYQIAKKESNFTLIVPFVTFFILPTIGYFIFQMYRAHGGFMIHP